MIDIKFDIAISFWAFVKLSHIIQSKCKYGTSIFIMINSLSLDLNYTTFELKMAKLSNVVLVSIQGVQWSTSDIYC